MINVINVIIDKMLILGWSNPLSCILSVSTCFLDEYIFYKKVTIQFKIVASDV